ncbi:MAG: cytochrome c3 family protein [Phycisphaerales bacterium]|nr:cytochrome c3 family protein [Phycisphaerales bacterium]
MKRAARISKLVLPGALLLIAGIATAGIKGSKHDFSNAAWSKDDNCGACHTPHQETPPKQGPLWNPNADLSRRFGTTAAQTRRLNRRDMSTTNDPTGRRRLAGRIFDPGAGTLTCLRCHDGALASDMIPTISEERPVNTFHPSTRVAGHGRSNHPVGIPYPGFGHDYHPVTRVTSSGAVVLPDGYVECLSCHDPHNESGYNHMLVMSNAGSALCLTCHRK